MAKIKKQIRIKEIVKDIRSGLPDSELIEKYRISAKGLQSVFMKLLEAQAVTDEDLKNRMQFYDDTGTLDFENLQFASGQSLTCLVTVFDHSNPEIRGSICEIQENGFMIDGIESTTGDIKKFVVAANDFFQIDSFTLEAVCKWSRNESPDDSRVSAYEITDISKEDRGKLVELVRLVRM